MSPWAIGGRTITRRLALVPILTVAAATTLALLGTLVAPGPTGSPRPSDALPAAQRATPGSTGAAATAAPTARAFVAVPVVPVTSFRAPWDSTDAAEVAATLAGTSSRYAAVELVEAQADVILAAVAATVAPARGRLVLAPDAAHLAADMSGHRDRLGFLLLPDVGPGVRALGWAGASLFGVHRVATLRDWPLTVQLRARDGDSAGTTGAAGAAGGASYDPATAWTLVAAGDINLDRLVAYTVKQEHKGVDFPFDGGTAVITGHACCNPKGNPIVIGHRTGNAGAVRSLISSADLALANFENPAPDNFAYHRTGYTFSADPALIEGVRNAGFDWLSLANNHIRNYGSQGVLDTLANLDRWGIAHGGAGGTLAQARRPSLFDVRGVTVAVIAYDTIRPDFAATASRPGTSEMSAAGVKVDVAAARAAGADVVIVFPHWGIEYTAQTTARQRSLAHAAIDAGADLVIGSHPHWAGGVEVYKGVPILYSLGDFVFDIDLSEQTLEGILPELTFEGSHLVQVRLDPYLILEVSQPNLLDPAGSGAVVMRQVFGASTRLPW